MAGWTRPIVDFPFQERAARERTFAPPNGGDFPVPISPRSGDQMFVHRSIGKYSIGGPVDGRPPSLLTTDGNVSLAVELDLSIRSDVQRCDAAANAVDAWPESVALSRWRPRQSGPTGSLEHCQAR